ncbi:MAG: hypothetical protein L0Z68_06400 [Gammaproteobacteria bacterium]|nr:hypothetical protein [Gammaproteobacteria bacterium]
MKSWVSIMVALWTTAIDCHAMDSDGNYAVWGAGRRSCYNYNQARAANEDREFKVYIMGYLTAYNVQTPETYGITGNTDWNGVLDRLDAYCQKSPVLAFESALRDLTQGFYADRLKHAPVSRTPGEFQ